MPLETTLTLLVSDDTPDGALRLDMTDARSLGAGPDDVVAIEGGRRTFVRVLPAFMEDRNQRTARVSPLTARNIGTQHGRSVRLFFEKSKTPMAERVMLEPIDDLDALHLRVRLGQLSTLWQKSVLTMGDEILLPSLDSHPLVARIASTQPAGAVVVAHATEFAVMTERVGTLSLPALGGLRDVYRTCRDLVAARFRKTSHGGTGAVLLTGPSGCGKALLVKRLARELDAAIKVLDVPHLVDQFLTTGTTDLSFSLSELARRGSTILLVDHFEVLEACRSGGSDLARAAHTVMSQICAILEEIPMQPSMALFIVSSGAAPDERLFKGPFLFRIDVDLPHRWARHEILLTALEGKRLAPDVRLGSVAAISGGMSARDLAGLCTAAANAADENAITQKDLVTAFHAFPVPFPGPIRCDIPDVPWESISGLDDIKKSLIEIMDWASHTNERAQAIGMSPPRSVLLSGGTGTGKTSIVRALAGFVPVHYIEVSCLLLVTRNESEGKNVARDVFALARRKAPCLVFLDNVDALFEGTFSPDEAVFSHPVVEQLMAELDAMTEIPGVVVIAATNRLDRLSNEILRAGRFDFSLALSLPDVAARKKIFQTCVKNMPVAADVDFDNLASVTHGFSPADIANLCNRVALMAFKRSFGEESGGVIPPVLDAELFEQEMRGRKVV